MFEEERTGKKLTVYKNSESRPVNVVVIPADIWQEIEQTAKGCQRSWGMGFPVISITLLKKILKRDPIGRIGRSIETEQV